MLLGHKHWSYLPRQILVQQAWDFFNPHVLWAISKAQSFCPFPMTSRRTGLNAHRRASRTLYLRPLENASGSPSPLIRTWNCQKPPTKQSTRRRMWGRPRQPKIINQLPMRYSARGTTTPAIHPPMHRAFRTRRQKNDFGSSKVLKPSMTSQILRLKSPIPSDSHTLHLNQPVANSIPRQPG